MNATSKRNLHRHFLRRMLFVLCAAWMLLSSTAFAGDLRHGGGAPAGHRQGGAGAAFRNDRPSRYLSFYRFIVSLQEIIPTALLPK